MILIAFDGTPGAEHAIRVAGTLLRNHRAHVVHVWRLLAGPTQALAFAAALEPEIDDELTRQEREARAVAEAGAALARSAGFVADGEAIELDDTAAALEDAIDRLRPDVIVVGSRGQSGLKALLSGSVSRHVGAHARVPVLIVPQQ